MTRYAAAVESQAAQLAGTPVTTTFNGYFAAVVAGAASNFEVRRIALGVRATTPTSQQVTVAVYRQTVRVAGTGFSTVAGQSLNPRAGATLITGIDVTTATTAGTTGPTIAANPMYRWTFNTLNTLDLPYGVLEELTCDQGTANAIAFVNIGAALPASHLFTLGVEWEE